jgi:RNA polymerase sigma-70 factor (ECF subfamily)
MAESEELLIRQAQQGKQSALAAIYEQYYDTIYTYIYFRLLDDFLAQDLTAEVFVRMVAHIPSFSYRQQSLLAWLYTIARNLVTDHFRANGSQAVLPLPEELVGHGRAPDDAAHLHLAQQQLAQAMASLTDEQRQIILLRFVEGRRLQEVARQLGKSEGAVKALQHRALAALRRTLVKEFGYETS